MTTFDRYLLGRFVSIFVGFFAASVGLFTVIDGFMNLDNFQNAAQDDGMLTLLVLIGRHYLFQTSWLFDLIGPTLATLAVVSVFALVLRHGELHPLLAAGVPTYRLALPFLAGILVVHGMLITNREVIIPPIADKLTAKHGEDTSHAQEVDPQYDRSHGLFVSGQALLPETRAIESAEFRLWENGLVEEFVSLRSPEARYFPADGDGPAGWYLNDVTPALADIRLTDLGRAHLIAQPNCKDVFVITDVSFDQLSTRGTNFTLLSTTDLIERIQQPSTGTRLQRAQVLHLHARLTQPLLNVIGIFLVVPLVIRRESLSLVTNMAVCMMVLGLIMAVVEGGQYLGRASLISSEFAAWGPLMFGSSLCAWLSPLVRT